MTRSHCLAPLALRLSLAALPLLAPGLATASVVETSAGPMRIAPMAEGLEEPWSLAFLPDGGFLVTERGGALTRYPAGGGSGTAIGGLPALRVAGQGGLLEVMVPADFATRGEVLISYAAEGEGGAGTTIAAARLGEDALEDLRVLWQMRGGGSAGQHFAGKIAEGPDGAIYLTTGERGLGAPAQDPESGIGAVMRVARDGSGAEVVSWGHRNPQGLAFDAEGRLWVSEHGARGGDEINLIREGANYGWPVIAHGVNYDGSRIGEGTARPGMEQPVHYWDPSIAPSGHMVHSGTGIAAWRGDHFLGSLKFDYIARMDPDDWSEERIEAPETGRVRDLREAPDGAVWFLSVDDGAVYRMAPEG
ncbi:PQQ-dependent sugar dehydrogenase [Frigidibacter sp. MR17.24]|uniref:PQQ-dependent sugar dehydrogenase n=1 Tax=Frigidibacter sp. MR17.24 TaxID=3127345 RepID=UPI0030131119